MLYSPAVCLLLLLPPRLLHPAFTWERKRLPRSGTPMGAQNEDRKAPGKWLGVGGTGAGGVQERAPRWAPAGPRWAGGEGWEGGFSRLTGLKVRAGGLPSLLEVGP